MSKESVKRRQFDIRAKRKRKVKIKKLKEKYIKAKSKEEKDKILEKIKRISPHYPVNQIIEAGKEK